MNFSRREFFGTIPALSGPGDLKQEGRPTAFDSRPTRRALIRAAAGVAAGGVLGGSRALAQEGQRPVFRVKVDMVVHSFQITDNKNHYIKGLKPNDFRIFEDGILQKISTFAEGSGTPGPCQ